MSCIQLDGVSYAYPGQPPVLARVSLTLSPGVTAIAGPNGGGKTTLLRLIAGELEPTAGSIRRDVAEIATVRQSPHRVPPEVLALSERWDRDAWTLRSRFVLPEDPVAGWKHYSPGERQRWQLAAALPDADTVLLDEPTNHLDSEGRSLLRETLTRRDGIAVLVSHDRALIDALAERTVWVEGSEVRVVEGGYTSVRAVLEHEHRSLAVERQKVKRERRRLEAERNRRSERAASATAELSTRKRMRSPKDSDARTAGARIRVESAATKHARASVTMASRVERLESKLSRLHVTSELGGAVSAEGAAAARRFVFRSSVGPLSYGDRVVVAEQEIAIRRSERVAITGPNGAGKSTLLRAIIERWPTEALTHLPQDITPEARDALLERLRSEPPEVRGRILTRLAALGVPPEHVLRSPRPSPGEARKLLLAIGLDQRSEALALDEPENHLDAPSLDRLEQMLDQFDGAVLVITHDQRLRERLNPTQILTP